MATQTGPTTLYTLAETAFGALVNGAAYTLAANAIDASVSLYLAQVATTAPVSGPPNKITIQGSQNATDDTTWNDLFSVSLGTTASATTTLNGAVTAGATTATLTGSGTFSARTGTIYIRDSSTAGEWVIGSQATTTLTVPSPGIVNAHLTGISVYDQAVKYQFTGVNIASLKRLRIRVDNNTQTSGPTIAVYATVETYG